MDPMVSTGIAAGGAALGVVLEDLYNQAKGSAKLQLNKLRARRSLENLYKKASEVRRVKTIWQVDKAIDLHEFYCPTKVCMSDTKKAIEIFDIEQFGESACVVIRGTVGQGKSIFLRYLASRELVKGQRIPIFLELRRVRQDETLVDAIERELVNLGFSKSRDLTEYLLKSGRVGLFLDAFDEIDAANVSRIVTEIEEVVRCYSCAVYTTTRPETAVCQSSFFSVFDVMPLQPGDYKLVVQKVCGEKDTAQAIIRGVEESGGSVRNVLTTPLMVALLVVRFRAEQSVPETRAAFYEGLFLLLLSRHDKSKAGYTRERKSPEGDSVFEDFFDNLCFETRKFGIAPISRPDVISLAKTACARCGIQSPVDSILDDVCRITCLLLEEGGEYRFIHKSVEEYHAARRIRRLPEADAVRVYTKIRDPSRWSAWRGELSFLETIDTYRYLKFFAIPDYKDAIGIETLDGVDDLVGSDKGWQCILALASKIFIHVQSAKDAPREQPSVVGFSSCPTSWSANHLAIRFFIDGINWRDEGQYSAAGRSLVDTHKLSVSGTDGDHVSVAEVIGGSSDFSEVAAEAMRDCFRRFVQQIGISVTYVASYEAQSRMIDL